MEINHVSIRWCLHQVSRSPAQCPLDSDNQYSVEIALLFDPVGPIFYVLARQNRPITAIQIKCKQFCLLFNGSNSYNWPQKKTKIAHTYIFFHMFDTKLASFPCLFPWYHQIKSKTRNEQILHQTCKGLDHTRQRAGFRTERIGS